MFIRLTLDIMKKVRGRREKEKQGGAQMKGLIKVAKGTGKVVLALLVGVLMPILIWVALGVALNRKMREKAVQTEVKTLGEVLDQANQTIKR
ncbi:MAG: hypothetical protein A2Y92_01590 [Chloroflexi bacterium RBG_13_57_8]|nr:MAG: hypothetical protein A2Y92_01590 [Chloroflexi bacterium RBG_13_57_8]